jgi:hypothetical protein
MFLPTKWKTKKKQEVEFTIINKPFVNSFAVEFEFTKISKSYSSELSSEENLLTESKEVKNRLISYKLGRISKLYTVQQEQEQEVDDFINQHTGLIDLVLEAHPQIKNYFPEEKLTLEVVTDYEYPDWKTLVISIWSNHYSDEVSQKLHDFEQNWWLDASGGVGVNLCITLEFE